jgi:hypothetical protein
VHHATAEEKLVEDAEHSFSLTVISTIFLFFMAIVQICEGLWRQETHYIFLTSLVSAKSHNMMSNKKGKVKERAAGNSGYIEMGR